MLDPGLTRRLCHPVLVADEHDLDVPVDARQLATAFRWMSPM